MRHHLFSIAAVCVLAGTAPAAPAVPVQGEAVGRMYTRADGSEIRAAVRIQISDGWHLYHTDLGDPEAIGKALSVEWGGEGIEWGEMTAPGPEREDEEAFGTWAWIHRAL